MNLNPNNTSCIPVEVRTALFRRAASEAFIAGCQAAGYTLHYSLDGLQMMIASEVESLYVKNNGPELGMEIACCLLSDMVESDLLEAAPRLTPLGYKLMSELCGTPSDHFPAMPVLH